jgi:Protein of unknown function (DUF1328)
MAIIFGLGLIPLGLRPQNRRHPCCTQYDAREDFQMLYYALMFLIVGLIAGALGLFGIAAIAGQIAWFCS